MSHEEYGRPFTRNVEMFALWWYSLPLRKLTDLSADLVDAHADEAFGGPGVYAFEGRHDSRPEGGLLYIGRVGSAGYDVDSVDPQRTLRERVSESSARFLWKDGTGSGLFADVWDVTIRFASTDPKSIVTVESLLIRAHAPSFNAQQVRGPLCDHRAANSVIMNGGEKGRLLPAVAGAYFDKDLWAAITGS